MFPSLTVLNRRTFLGHAALFAAAGLGRAAAPEPLAGTQPLDLDGDLARRMVDGLHKYLDRELKAAQERRLNALKMPPDHAQSLTRSATTYLAQLRTMLGIQNGPAVEPAMELLAVELTKALPAAMELGPAVPQRKPMPIARGANFWVYAVRWPVLPGVEGEGLLLEPDGEPKAQAVCVPDADWTPEQFAGLTPGVPSGDQIPRRMALAGLRVIVPCLIDRRDTWSANPALGRATNQPHREFLHRMAFEMGRTLLGYEVEKVLAAFRWLDSQAGPTQLPARPPKKTGVYGHGEGGLIALLCGALEPTIQFTGVSGYLGTGDTVWDAPLYRNLWGFLSQVGDGGLAVLVAPRMLFVRHTEGPKVDGPPPPQPGRAGAAPGRLVGPDRETLKDLKAAIGDTYGGLGAPGRYSATEANLRDRGHWSDFLQLLGLGVGDSMSGTQLQDARKDFDPDVRLKRQFDQLVEHTQRVVRQAEDKRQEFFWTKLNLKTLADYQQSCAPLRQYLLEEVIGKLPPPDRPANPRSRPLHDEPKWRSYEVTLDLYGDVFAQGILCVPKGLKAGERRPVVVCQHGLEGRPTDVVNPKEVTKYYHSFGSALADRGFVVFAPQNPYIFQNHFRQLQRKANPLKLSLFSFIVRQHERILDWLAGLPFVDEKRMGFYGLSYGGKTAMRVPALLDRYCLSICSGDFNEWIWKNTSVDFRGSYLYTNEYEMPEFDLGNTFGYAEMAALIAPRPFMVERGHDDGVGIDEWVAYEYAKVRRLYAKLGIPERTAIEFFNGGHQINSQGTFAFLHKHLNWPAPA